MRDENVKSKIGIFNLHPTKVTQWVVQSNEKFFESYFVLRQKHQLSIQLKDVVKFILQNIKTKEITATGH